MYKKVAVIIILALLLGLILYFKPFKSPVKSELKIENILPESDLVGRVNLLDFLKETSELLNFNNVPLRGFLTYEFMLSMAKNYGIDLQSRLYVFANDRGDYGCVIPLNNSEKLGDAIERISVDFDVSITKRGKVQIYHISEENIYFFNRDKYVLIYKGNYFSEIYTQVLNSKPAVIRTSWKNLFSDTHFKNEHVVFYSQNEKIKEYGIDHVYFAHDSDSAGFYMKSRVKMNDSIPFLMNKKGKSIQFSSSSNRKIDLHLNFSHLSKNTKKMIEKKLNVFTQKISFPMEDFLNLWGGDLCFEEGGYYKISEKYIETELDENFETREIEKTRDVIVPRYKLMFSTVHPAHTFISKLITKGIITQEEDQFRFLFSPLFKYKIKKDVVLFYSSQHIPRLVPNEKNTIHWDYKGTNLEFSIDSSINNVIYGGLDIPVQSILKNVELP